MVGAIMVLRAGKNQQRGKSLCHASVKQWLPVTPQTLRKAKMLCHLEAPISNFFRKILAHPKGLEPLTPRFVVWCSIQLSYGCAVSGYLAEHGGVGNP